jgi:GNAT superfamily N-acetyltransferase
VRTGIGRALLRVAERELAAEGGPRLLWCNARLGAVGFYERLGWTVVSDVFDIPTVGPHRIMTSVL